MPHPRLAAALLLLATPTHAETCRFEGTTSHDGHLAMTTTVTETLGTLTIDVALVFTATAWLTNVEYRSQELTTWRQGQLQTAAINNRTILDGRISRQQWDVFTRTQAGLQARRVQSRTLPEFQDKHPAFAPHWPLQAFARPWLADYPAARPAPRPDLGLPAAPPTLRTPLALAFYWSRFLPPEGAAIPVFLPGFKHDARTDLRIPPATQGPDWQRWLVPLHHPALDPIRPSALAAWVSPDHYLLQLAADLHAEAGTGTAQIRTQGCQGVQIPPT